MNSPTYLRSARLEVLEDRIAPATIVVNTDLDVNDPNDGVTTLREAIALANSTAKKDTIVFDKTFFSTPHSIKLALGSILIDTNVKIKGLGADLITISGEGSQIFNITDSNPALLKSVVISGVTLTKGNATVGGAINSTESLTLVNSVISGNNATSTGGGINFNGTGTNAKLAISNCQFLGNSSDVNGGAVNALVDGTGSIKISKSLFSGNKAVGGIGGGLTLLTVSGTKSSILIDKSSILNNTAGGKAGGIFLAGNADKSSLTLRNTIISGNVATGQGGGVYINGITASSATKISLVGTTVSNNSSAAVGLAGGGLFVNGGATDTLIIKKSGFLHNSATDADGQGGGIVLEGDVVAKILGSTVRANKASDAGGGIASNTQNLLISASTIDGNLVNDTNSDGGGLYSNKDNAVISISKSTFSGNGADDDGGGVFVAGMNSSLNVIKSKFVANTASGANGEGGGISIGTTTKLAVSKSQFSQNFAGFAGGGIGSTGNTSDIQIKASTFSGNISAFGGGLSLVGGTGGIGVTSSKFIGNSATNIGGGMYLGSSGVITLSKNLLDQNTAVSGSGGGMALTGTGEKVLISNIVRANTSGMNGGGIFLQDGTLTLSKIVKQGKKFLNKITGNVALVAGGGIFNGTGNPNAIANNGAKISGNWASTDPNISG